MKKIKDKPEDVKMQELIKSRANYSLSILGKAFILHGSGRFLNIRSEPPKRRKHIKNEYKLFVQPAVIAKSRSFFMALTRGSVLG